MAGVMGSMEACVPALRRYARSLLRDRQEVDDLVHDCLVRALDRLHTHREEAELRPWLFTIMHNLFVSRIRRLKRRGVMEPIEAADLATLEYLHAHKTGALFLASVRGGGLLGGGDTDQLAALTEYGRALGLAFQVIDDILDVEASAEQLGKRTHKDDAHGKATYPALMGVEKSRAFAHQLKQRAIGALDSFDQRAEPLRQLAAFVVERSL